MAQTTISTNPAIGIAGQWADAQNGANQSIGKVAVETIPAGCGVVVTAADEDTCELPDATGEVAGTATAARFLGIALRPMDGSASYAAGEVVRIATVGVVWVATEDSSTAGEKPFVRFADAATTLGTFRSDADTADAVALPNALWNSTQGTAAGMAKVKLGNVFS